MGQFLTALVLAGYEDGLEQFGTDIDNQTFRTFWLGMLMVVISLSVTANNSLQYLL